MWTASIVACGSATTDARPDTVATDGGSDLSTTPAIDATAEAPIVSTDAAPTDATLPVEATVDAAPELGAGELPIGCAIRATTDVNLRAGPSTSDAILHVIPSGDTATVVASAPVAGFINVSHGGATGWAFGVYFDTSCATSPPADASTDTDVATLGKIEAIAAASDCAAYAWKNRGQAPKGYVEGVADVFARAVCNPTRTDVVVVSQARTTDDAHDALSWYASNFTALGMSNDAAGVDTLRHTYTLLLGLGMRESSGQHCCGRDMSATNVSSDSAEAGAWQTSWDSHGASPELPKLFARYRTSDVGCLLSTFSREVTCDATNWQDWGSGADGLDFQKREKDCPAFAAEYAAVMLRVEGGSLGHYGPLRTKAAEIRPECDAMLRQVQSLVEATPALCAGL